MFDKDLFTLIMEPLTWDKSSYAFSRDEKDMRPCSIMNLKDKTIIVHNVLGIDKKDLKITRKIENGIVYLLIEGKTKDSLTGKDYSISSTLQLDETQLNIDKISCNMKNGLVYITIPKETVKKDNLINISIAELD